MKKNFKMVPWQSGYVGVCKTSDADSNSAGTSKCLLREIGKLAGFKPQGNVRYSLGSRPRGGTNESEVQGLWRYDGIGRHASEEVDFDIRTGSSPVVATKFNNILIWVV